MTSTPPPFGQQPDLSKAPGADATQFIPGSEFPPPSPPAASYPPAAPAAPYPAAPPAAPYPAAPYPAAPYPPAPPSQGHGAVKAPSVAWLIPIAGAFALVGAVTPWFRPEATAQGRTISAQDSIYVWDDGKIGLLGPIILIAIGIAVVGLLMGKVPARFARNNRHPVENAARASAIAGVVALVCAGVAWALVPSQYKQWDEVKKAVEAAGGSISRGPEIGFYLTGVAGLVALVGAALILLAHRKSGQNS